MKGLLWLGLALFAAWVVLWLGFKVVGAAIHLLMVAAVLLVIAAVVRGAMARRHHGVT